MYEKNEKRVTPIPYKKKEDLSITEKSSDALKNYLTIFVVLVFPLSKVSTLITMPV